MNNKIIYFDNAAKSFPYEELKQKYVDLSTNFYANPSSIHILGRNEARMLDKAKEEILSILKMNNHQVLFVSSASEANNLAIKGYALKYKNRGNHLITSIYEHPSVLEAFKQLEEQFGFEVTYLLPNEKGVISLGNVVSHLKKETILVSLMAVNNEIGSVNPIEEIANELTKYPKIAFHVDASQAIGKLEKEINYSKVDLLSVSSHKLHGLIGIASLIKKKTMDLLPLISGGGQEYNLRSGTNDLALSLCFLDALKKSVKEEKNHYNIVKPLGERLYSYLESRKDLYHINSSDVFNPYIINFSTINKKSSVVVEALSNKGIMVSSTSACHSKNEKGSYVVKAIYHDDNLANNTVRVSFSYLNTMEEVEIFIKALEGILEAIR